MAFPVDLKPAMQRVKCPRCGLVQAEVLWWDKGIVLRCKECGQIVPKV